MAPASGTGQSGLICRRARGVCERGLLGRGAGGQTGRRTGVVRGIRKLKHACACPAALGVILTHQQPPPPPPHRKRKRWPAALFQLELSDVLLVFTAKDIYMLAASKKAKIAQTLSEKLPESFGRKLVVMTRDKTDKDAANFGKILDEIKASKEGKKLASLPKEKLAGAFAECWEKALKDSGLDIVDVQNGISDFLSIKSAHQIDAVRKGSALGSEAFKKEIINKILDVVDEENTKFSMLKMTEQIEDKIPKLAKDQKLDDSEVEVVLPPVVQSASGGYDLKYSAQVQDKALALPDQGVPAIHVASITLRYKLVSCTVARTLLFNSKKEQADNYKTLFQMVDECLVSCRAEPQEAPFPF